MSVAGAAEQDAPLVCGWYGKLPAVGDFALRRLPTPMVERCDAWLSNGLAASQQALGSDWLDLYLTAPIWRFAWWPGIAGAAAWMGVLMPSVDRVGRYFPLLLAAPCPAGTYAAADHPAPGNEGTLDWLDRLADTAQDCLQPGATLDSFEAALAADPRPTMASPLWSAAPPGHSLWWTDRTHRHDWPGLPDGTAFAALLQGDG